MSGLAAPPPPVPPPVPAPPAPRAPRPGLALPAALADPVTRELTIRFATFLALGMLAAFQWASLVENAPGGRVAGVVLISAAGGLVMALAGVLAGSRRWIAGLVAAGTALGTIWLSFLAIGLPGEMLPPAGWGELGELVDRGLTGLQTVDWPYGGDDPQVRLTLLLAIPAALAPAAALAFWPDERLQPVLRAQALILLLVLYGVAVTEREPDAPLLHGLILLALIAAWLWLPRLRSSQAVAALAAVAAAGIAAVPLAAGFDADKPWIDYEEWRWAQSSEKSDTFDWNHSYGPIDWPRDGRTVLNVRSERGHYWKVQTLNHYDGLRWLRTGSRIRPGTDFPDRIDPRWQETVGFSVRSLNSEFVVSAGMTYDIDLPDRLATVSADGTIELVNEPLREGDSYSVETYVPDPEADEMRAASGSYGEGAREHTYFALPRRGESALETPQRGDASRSAQPPALVVALPLWGAPDSAATPGARRALLRSPYADAYRLARRLTAGAPTAYDAVKRIENHLQSNYEYSESPPQRNHPLAAFLFEDRIGYCQQFSGAMALLLRMNGIPARVAAGFSPGQRDRETGEYRVTDLDAHSWVEVWFEGIGWVPFDPTPSAAPAESQSGGERATSAARGDAPDQGDGGTGDAARDSDAASPGAGTDTGFRVPIWTLPVMLLVALGALAAFRLAAGRRRARMEAVDDLELDELRRALERLGYEVAPGTTLLGLERRLGSEAGPGAARYARLLRERRFAPPGKRSSGGLDRRALRRALTGPLRGLAKLRAWRALPPRPGRFTPT